MTTHHNSVITDSLIVDATSLPRVVMPAASRFVRDNRRGGPTVK